MNSARLIRIPTLKTVEDFSRHVADLGIELPCDAAILTGSASPLSQPLDPVRVNGKTIGNRLAIQPMEGWDGTRTGGITEEVRRRWRHFGSSGAKLIWGGEAMAVRADGRANPNQLMITPENKAALAELRGLLVAEHADRFGKTDDLVVGFQLTHSGRFCKPNDHARIEPHVGCRHPILDRRYGVISDDQVFTDDELSRLVEDYVRAARIAHDVGADFVDIKHCHGYLLHELLGAHVRPGRFGGSFENRTRLFSNIVQAIRASGNPIEIGVRLSAFDMVPFRPDPQLSTAGRPGRGIPEDWVGLVPYLYGFGVNRQNPTEPDLEEAHRFLELAAGLGVKLVNITAGSPYYNPHIQRPAAYPPSDGYLPPEDPLVGVARQVQAVRQLRAHAPAGMVIVGSAYSYLQEYLPHVAQFVVRSGWADIIGVGRMVLSYPTMLQEAMETGAVNPKVICRTFSDCTTAPRNGLVSGCYPLDKYYASKPEAARLKELKRASGV